MKDLRSDEFGQYWKYYTVSTAGSLLGECKEMCHAKIICGLTEFHLNEFRACAQQFVSSSSTLRPTFTIVAAFVGLAVFTLNVETF